MRTLTIMAAMAALVACSAPDDTGHAPETDAPPEAPDTDGADPGTPDTALLPAGRHCYFRGDENTTEGLELTVSDDGALSGENYGTIHQESEAYYASFDIELTNGSVDEDGLVTFESVTQVDGDTQIGMMTWSISPEAAAPEGFLDEPMQPAECEGLTDRVFP